MDIGITVRDNCLTEFKKVKMEKVNKYIAKDP